MNGGQQLKLLSHKHSYIWDPEIELQYLESLPENHELDLQQLTHKLTMLLALSTGQPVQTLKALHLDFVAETADTIYFNSPKKFKQTVRGRDIPTI